MAALGKIRPLRKIDVQKRIDRNPGFIELQSSNHNIRVPLRNRQGLLQGVFETPTGKIVTIRFGGHSYDAYIGSKKIGFVDRFLQYRQVEKGHRLQGIGNALFDLAERNGTSGENLMFTGKKDTAAFLMKRGWKPVRGAYELLAKELKEEHQPLESSRFAGIVFEKKLEGSQFDRHKKWHRIQVIGRNGKPIWLTLRVLPEEK